MSESKFTPGPWKAHKDARKGADGRHFVLSETSAVAEMLRTNDDVDVPANTRLVASAPDLLRALELMLEAVSYPQELGPGRWEINGKIDVEGGLLDVARRAVAKAKGGGL